MPIAKNRKPTPEQQAAIQAFGAAADARPEDVSYVQPVLTSKSVTHHTSTPRGEEPPKSTLVRWGKNEELRDRVIEYSKRERYSVHDTILEALRLGMEQIEKR